MGLDFESNDYKQAPGLMFVSGQYDKDIIKRSIDNNWLVKNRVQTTPYTELSSTNYTYKSSIEPHKSLKIDLTGNYTRSQNASRYIVYDGTNTGNNYNGFDINASPNVTGNFNISTFTFFRSFKDGGDPVNSKLFTEFLQDRSNVARSLSGANPASSGSVQVIGGPAYYDGYSDNQQDVLMGAFYRTYTGKSIKKYNTQNIFPNIPMPNWTVTWDGLGKIPGAKKYFRGIIVRHAYRSTYSINAFSNNLLFNTDGKTQDQRVPINSGAGGQSANFVPYYNISAVTISESYAPLIKLEFQFQKSGWSANVETKRDKSVSLNLTGLQVIETKGQEYVTGLAYLIPKLRIQGLKIQGKVLESNLNLRLDLSYRQNLSVIRRVTDGLSVPTGGTDIITMRSSADYMLTSNVTLRIFYDWIKTKPKTSASFPTSNVNAGFSLRINFQ